jgi:hypothetical protein
MVFVWSLVLLVQFLFLYSLFSFTFTTCFPLIHPKCHDHESHALLQFKKSFHINNSASLNPLSYPKTASWNSSTDCCSWDGIQCDDHTNQVIHIDLSSSQLYGRMDANSSWNRWRWWGLNMKFLIKKNIEKQTLVHISYSKNVHIQFNKLHQIFNKGKLLCML